MTRQLHFMTTLPSGREGGSTSWRLPEAPRTLQERIAYNFETVRIAEAGKFDAVLYADVVFGSDPEFWRRIPSTVLESLTLISAFASITEKIGLITTLSSTFDAPFQAARRVLSLDHLSNGRAALNIVTNFNEDLAAVNGLSAFPSHSDRYRKADEFAQIVKALWDGFEGDAAVLDIDTATFNDPRKIHPMEFKGDFFDVSGLLGQPRSVQGRPVIVQAGSSPDGIEFATKHADVIFTAQLNFENAVAFRKDAIRRVRAMGRQAPPVLPGLNVIIGSTDEEAQRLERRYIDAVISPGWIQNHLIVKTYFNPADLAAIGDDLDAPLPPFLDHIEGYQTAFNNAKAQVGDRKISVREFFELQMKNDIFPFWVGTPEYIANEIERWFRQDAADGFILIGGHDLNAQLRLFTEQVVPILQKRGLFRTDYEGSTLRDHLRLPIPANQFVQHESPVQAFA